MRKVKMDEDFSLENLKRVDEVIHFVDDHTVAFVVHRKDHTSYRINMSEYGSYDDKFAGTDCFHVAFLVRMIEAITGRRFEREKNSGAQIVRFVKTRQRYNPITD